MPSTLFFGFCAMRSAAVAVSAGALAPEGLAVEKRVPQGLPSPAAPPPELTQLARISERLYSFAFSVKELVAEGVPGEVPCALLTNSRTLATAVRKEASPDAEPRWVASVI